MQTAKTLQRPINWGVIHTTASGVEMIFSDSNYLPAPERRANCDANDIKHKHERRI